MLYDTQLGILLAFLDTPTLSNGDDHGRDHLLLSYITVSPRYE
jgi:hypothetical protein